MSKYKYYEMDSKRAKAHHAIYMLLVKNKGIESVKAYYIASKITNWA